MNHENQLIPRIKWTPRVSDLEPKLNNTTAAQRSRPIRSVYQSDFDSPRNIFRAKLMKSKDTDMVKRLLNYE